MRNPSNADYAWKNGVRKLYGRVCVITGKKEGVVLHHLDAYDTHIERRYDVTNGVPLSREVHKRFHDQYGYGKNTEHQFIEFCQNNYNFDWVAHKNQVLNQSTIKLFGNHQPSLMKGDFVKNTKSSIKKVQRLGGEIPYQ
jgi:hypothetical protein